MYEVERQIRRQYKWDKRFLALAEHISLWSKDPSTKVGAVIVRPDLSICSTGYNGFPQKLSDAKELYENRETKYSRVIHGEINAILFARESLIGYNIYLHPFLSCDRCTVQIIQSGITRVITPLMGVELKKKTERWADAFEIANEMYKEAGVKVDYINMDEHYVVPLWGGEIFKLGK